MGLSASAPGKLMLSGEYAVLDGAPAIVAAVDARARVTLTPAAATAASTPPTATRDGAAQPLTATPPEVRATWELARQRFPTLPREPPCVDVRALRDPSGAQKLGLGSSAAAAAGTAALALALADVDADADAANTARGHAPDALFRLAFEGHRVVAPEGSGADVAASSWGGFIRFDPARGGETWPRCTALLAPAGLIARVVWTGHAARTSDLVAQVRRYGERDERGYKALAAELRGAAVAFADAFEAGQLDLVIALTERYYRAMQALGAASGTPIVEARLAEVARLATEAGGRAKPSGAGGGDVAIAFFRAARDADTFDALVAGAGFEILGLALGAAGPRVEG